MSKQEDEVLSGVIRWERLALKFFKRKISVLQCLRVRSTCAHQGQLGILI